MQRILITTLVVAGLHGVGGDAVALRDGDPLAFERPAAGCAPTIVVDAVSRATGKSPTRPIASPEIALQAPGTYCLGEDVTQARMWDWHANGFKTSSDAVGVVSIEDDDIRFDLAGHRVENRWYPHGGGLIFLFRRASFDDGYVVQRATVRNGTIISPGAMGIGARLLAMGKWGARNQGKPVELQQGQQPLDHFPDTGHLLERLMIHGGKHAIVIDGRNNVIRDNHLVVDSSTAIVATGPGLLLEGNDIEVKGTLELLRGDEAPPYAVRLVQADGAVIRNNRIRYTGGTQGRPSAAAFQLVESRDVTFEGNRLEAVGALVSADARSSHGPTAPAGR